MIGGAIPVLPAGTSVLVTGAGGLLGGVLARRLAEQGCRARLLVRRAEQARNLPQGLEVVVGDVTDAAAVARAAAGTAVVLHLAAATRGSREDFERTNIDGTRNVVKACLAHPQCRLVHVSSIGVLDHAGHDPSVPLREDAALEPQPERRGYYTQTKLAAEAIVRQAMAEQGLAAVVLRPGQIFGPGFERVTPNGVVAMRGWNLVGDGRQLLPLVYVDDVIDALLLAACRGGVDGRVFHVVDTTPVTQQQYLAAWRQRIADIPLRRIPLAVALGLAALMEFVARLLGRDAQLSRYRIRSLRPLSGFDTSCARDVLGWSPRVGVRRGLELCFGTRKSGSPDT